MVEDVFDDGWVFDDRDDAHSTTAGTFEDVDVVDAFEQGSPVDAKVPTRGQGGDA